MTKRGNPKFFQVLVCQIRQDCKIDVILGKTLGVLPETERLKPVRNLLHRGTADLSLPDRAIRQSLSDKFPTWYDGGHHRPYASGCQKPPKWTVSSRGHL